MNNSTMLLATMFMERKPSYPPRMFVIHKKWMDDGETVDLEVEFLHFIFP